MRQGTGWPLLDAYRAWLRGLEAMMGGAYDTPPSQEGYSTMDSFVPAALTQPINPGWIFGNVSITNENSGDPEVEREIVRTASYGRQLGRLSEAVAVLIDHLNPDALTDEQKALVPDKERAFNDFWALFSRIDTVKSAGSVRALSDDSMRALVEKLRRLKEKDRERYERLVAILRSVLDG